MNPAGFSFPLNAYAAMLQWSEGRADSLHYGLFEHAGEPIAVAQQRASDKLWALLPPPCRVLDVGVGLGTTLERLIGAGYAAHGISPDARQVAAVAARLPGARVEVARLEDLGADRGPWDLMLFQESAQYIEPLALFEAAQRLLAREHATIVVMDEFALERRSDEDRRLHLLSDFVALAQRCGWRLVCDEDLSAAARITVDALLTLSERHRERLVGELGICRNEIDALDASNRRYRECYACGVFGYRLLKFERDAPPVRLPVSVVPAHRDAMRALFAKTFGREMGQAEWHWKYRDGHGVGLLRGDGTLCAHYGGLTRRVTMFGVEALGCQVCDVMVSSEANRALSRRGALHEVTASFLEAQIGYGRRHAVGFGFPNERALRVAERLGLYARVDEMVQIEWPAAIDAASVATVVDIAALEDGDPRWSGIEHAWRAMAAALPRSVLGVRDAGWLRWRYRDKPGASHALLLRPAGPAGLPGGAAVVRRHDGWLEWLDLVADPLLWPALAREVRHHAATTGAPLVRAWITASHEHLLRHDRDGAMRAPLNVQIPANAHTAGVPPEALQGRWLLMGGDTDFR